MESFLRHITKNHIPRVMKVQSSAMKAIHDFMHENGVLQLMPVILSPITDPLCHPVFDAKIVYYGQSLKLTKSMLLHKQIALIPEGVSSIYVISPNVRLESAKTRESGRHLIEFSQLDIEFKDRTKKEFMAFTESLIVYLFKRVNDECAEELSSLDRKIAVPKAPFMVYDSSELRAKYGAGFEMEVSSKSDEPFWILNYKREFYDREDPYRHGYYHNYDLVWPEGFGEGLSGGERDFEFNVLVRKMKERKMKLETYRSYLRLAELGHIPKTVGGGLGIERLIRFITGLKHIGDICLFPRVPGEKMLF